MGRAVVIVLFEAGRASVPRAASWPINHSGTLQPKNKPFEFELWAVPLEKPELNQAPWLPLNLVTKRLYSMEHGFGFKEEEVKEGDEKYAFIDGQTCVLKRPGHRDIRFTVPTRNPVVVHDDAEPVMYRFLAFISVSVVCTSHYSSYAYSQPCTRHTPSATMGRVFCFCHNLARPSAKSQVIEIFANILGFLILYIYIITAPLFSIL
ncbi:hypothetical protein C8Q77DRAFT_1212295 [Trametes polyzona]|nr:hypothetical protein C8Q77DRAFT_1212295 [Trametes polyzona]